MLIALLNFIQTTSTAEAATALIRIDSLILTLCANMLTYIATCYSN